VKSYIRNTINLSCAKILLTSVISTLLYEQFSLIIQKRSSKYHVEQIPIMRAAKTQTLNLKFMKKLQIKNSSFLKIFCCKWGQNWNGYCNVDFVFTLDPTNTSFICGIRAIFSIKNFIYF